MPPEGAVPPMLVDVMLGSLAKWLRILGVDADYSNDRDDPTLVQLALQEDRTLLTRDIPLAATGALEGRVILIDAVHTRDQLLEVARAHPALLSETRTPRCVECNEPLEEVPKGQVEGLVPPYVFRTQASFSRCPSCRKLFWKGTHRERMGAVLDELRSALASMV